MAKRLVNGYFSSVPLAQILTSTADIEPEDEVKDDPVPAPKTGN